MFLPNFWVYTFLLSTIWFSFVHILCNRNVTFFLRVSIDHIHSIDVKLHGFHCRVGAMFSYILSGLTFSTVSSSFVHRVSHFLLHILLLVVRGLTNWRRDWLPSEILEPRVLWIVNVVLSNSTIIASPRFEFLEDIQYLCKIRPIKISQLVINLVLFLPFQIFVLKWLEDRIVIDMWNYQVINLLI